MAHATCGFGLESLGVWCSCLIESLENPAAGYGSQGLEGVGAGRGEGHYENTRIGSTTERMRLQMGLDHARHGTPLLLHGNIMLGSCMKSPNTLVASATRMTALVWSWSEKHYAG